MRRFSETLNYSSVNEDWLAEAEGLQLQDGDRVLCVTGSGDRALDLLAVADCAVTAIDLNPAQNHLLHLKIAAMRELGFGEYARFIGLELQDPGRRQEVFDRLELPSYTRAWFAARPQLIAGGVLYQGRWERHYKRVSRFGRLVRRRDMRRLFRFTDLEEQAAWVRAHWDTPIWKAAWWASCNRWTSKLIFGDPAYYDGIDVDPTRYLYEGFKQGLLRHLARDSFMASLALRGTLLPGARPPYLTPQGVALIKPRLDRIEVVTANLLEHLEQTDGYTRMSLSDVPSFCDRAAFARLMRGVVRAGSPGCRVVIRQFMTRHEPADDAGFVREPELEERLARLDRAFCYRFIVGTVQPGAAR